MRIPFYYGLLGLTLIAHGGDAELWRSLRIEQREAVVAALETINLTPDDPGFEKDLGEPLWTLARNRALLGDPLALPEWGDEVVAAARGSHTMLTAAIGDWLEAPPVEPLGISRIRWRAEHPKLDPRLCQALTDAIGAFGAAEALSHRALRMIDAADREAAAAALFSGAFLIDDHPERRPALATAGLSATAIDQALADGLALDPEPAARRFLDAVQAVRPRDGLQATEMILEALATLRDAVAEVSWPDAPVVLPSPLGPVVVGTLGADVYSDPALLILDPGGDDLYRGDAGVANGLRGHPLAAILDLGGDDRYMGEGLLAPGTALFGYAVIWDEAGDDDYQGALTGPGAAWFGGAWVEDRAGNDRHRAYAFGQGAGTAGFGVVRDGAGDDRYDIGLCGQGFAGVHGVGLLIDRAGNDLYHAGGRRTDYDRNLGRHLSLAQGASVGRRPFAGGGLGALVDFEGNDHYIADVYGQGVGYWYATGMLLDLAGEDHYHLFQYGQGAGIHLSLGMLVDGGGRDVYTGQILCQGSAHDYAVGLLIDHGGDDVYTGDHHVQGRAINNSFALLLDAGGDDAYFARQPERAQGIGDNGHDRDYAALALLIDLGGVDHYSLEIQNGEWRERPDVGAVIDVE